MDPYLKKVAEEQKRLLVELQKKLGEQGMPIKKIESTQDHIQIDLGGMQLSKSGLFLPFNANEVFGIPPTYENIVKWMQKPKEEIAKEKVISSQQEMFDALWNVFTQMPIPVGNSWGKFDDDQCPCPWCTEQRGPRGAEQRVLRAVHKSRSEYVWSDKLQMHVEIGESLRRKNP